MICKIITIGILILKFFKQLIKLLKRLFEFIQMWRFFNVPKYRHRRSKNDPRENDKKS